MDPDLREFVSEAVESYGSIERLLLLLEQGEKDPHILKELLRHFHSVKGASGFFSLTYTQALCHVCEDVLSSVQNKEIWPTESIISALFQALDALRKNKEALLETGEEAVEDYSELLLQLTRFDMESEGDSQNTKIVSGGEDGKKPEAEELIQLVYLSVSRWRLDTRELVQLLCTAREKNRALNVSGMLLYRDDYFLQVLEGPKKPVQLVFNCIQKDQRHHHIVKLGEGHIPERSFPGWSMGFHHMKALKKANIDGLNKTITENLWPEATGAGLGFVHGLLRSFRDNISIM
ncbi:BLUF domain-containing protein [bacterium]|nr:BLUF domain-containing protein [bacterium]